MLAAPAFLAPAVLSPMLAEAAAAAVLALAALPSVLAQAAAAAVLALAALPPVLAEAAALLLPNIESITVVSRAHLGHLPVTRQHRSAAGRDASAGLPCAAARGALGTKEQRA